MCKFMYLQYNNLLSEVFADYFTLVSKVSKLQYEMLLKKFFTFLECTLLKDSHHVYI